MITAGRFWVFTEGNLEEATGTLRSRFRELRVLARAMGADSIVLEIDFMRRYLFENRAVGSDTARRDITRLLGWHSGKKGNARYVALRRLRVRMQVAWQSATERVFPVHHKTSSFPQ